VPVQSSLFLDFGPLVRARFLERPHRFSVRCRLEDGGETVEAHLADPGRLQELLVPDALLFLSPADNPARKTKWSAVLVESSQSVLVSLRSALVNELVSAALRAKAVTELASWDLVRSEFPHGGSRFDFLLAREGGERLLLEVKSCSLVEDGLAMFPDAVTARGTKHLQELAELQAEGAFQAAVLFVVQRSDARAFRPAVHIDPRFAAALRLAGQAGVRVLAYNCRVEEKGISWGHQLPVQLS
jgi:sugar fermentation stimulation protein A